jgi:hypothetical protein
VDILRSIQAQNIPENRPSHARIALRIGIFVDDETNM